MAKKIDIASLNRLNYAAFENIIYPYCYGYVKYINGMGSSIREKRTRQNVDLYVLLRAGFTEEDWNEHYSYKVDARNLKYRLSNMRKPDIGYKFIRDYEIAAYSTDDPNMPKRVYSHFKEHLLPLIDDTKRVNVTSELYDLIERDLTLPSHEYHKVMEAYETRDFLTFITEAFIVSMVRDTLPADIAYRRYVPDEYDLFPEIEDYLLSTHINGFSQDSFLSVLAWMADLLSGFDGKETEFLRMEAYVKTGWNAVAFWKATRSLIDESLFDESCKENYELVRRKAFEFEVDDYLWRLRASAHEISERYGYDVYISMYYDESEDRGWKIEIDTNTQSANTQKR